MIHIRKQHGRQFAATGSIIVPLLLCASCLLAADFTFFGYSDTHYGAETSGINQMVDIINSLPGTAYPASIGGVVDTPRGIIMPGDLINDGAVASKYQTQWASYVADFGVNGDGRCKFPVFEGLGNHDVNTNLFIFNKIEERNVIRKKLKLISDISQNGYHYSWDWDGIHFVNVNLFPGSTYSRTVVKYSIIFNKY